MRYNNVAFVCAMLLCAVLGCATVDPRPEYDRLGTHIDETTGQAEAYRPGDDGRIAGRVDELLKEGITLDEAVKICLLNNPAFQAAWMEIGMSKADLVQSGLLSNPSLGGSLRFPAGGGLANLELMMAQNIADLWQIPAKQRASQAGLDQAILTLARKASELAADARGAYFRCIGAQQLHDVADENLSIAQQLLELALGRQAAGAGSELEVNLSRGAVLEAELAVEAARLAAAENRRALAGLLGLTAGPDEIVLRDSFLASAPVELTLDAAVECARRRRLDLQAAERAVVQAEARISEEYRKIFNNVELGLSMERAERKAQPGRKILADTARASVANGRLTAPEIQPRSERRQNTDFIIGPSWNLELPIFDQNQAQIAKAEYAYQQAVLSRESVDRLIVQEVGSAADRMGTAWKISAFYRDRFIPLAQDNLDLSRESYKAGRASFLSVLEAQRFYLDTRRRSIEATQAAAETIPEVERAVGVPIGKIQGLRDEHPQTRPAASQPIRGGPS